MNIKFNNHPNATLMNSHLKLTESTGRAPHCSLYEMIERISGSLNQTAKSNKTHIVNNVSEEIFLQLEEDKVACVFSRLLNSVILHSRNSCVRISSKRFGNIVLLHLKDDGCVNYDSISDSLSEIQKQAERIGGFVGFTSYRNKLTTIAFSFTNQLEKRPDLFN